MQSYNNLHLNHLCQILFRNGKIKNEEHFSNIKDNGIYKSNMLLNIYIIKYIYILMFIYFCLV